MCEHHDDQRAPDTDGPVPAVSPPGRTTRRNLLGAAFATTTALGLSGLESATASPRLPSPFGRPAATPAPPIRRRNEWGPGLSAGFVPDEDVRFLLVHHTAEPGSNYGPDDVARLLTGIHGYHTGTKGWPDIAYNFFVDRFGTIWEGRAGSVDRPVQGSATGGNQGSSQLCCFLGDFSVEAPPAPALDSMYRLLAWLADRFGVDTTPGATTKFVSRGSNLHAAGVTVTTPTIAAHRDMSQTTCPGEACYQLVRSVFPTEVSARRGSAQAPPVAPTQPPSSTPTTSAPEVQDSTTAPTTTAPTTSSSTTQQPTTEPSVRTSETTAATEPAASSRSTAEPSAGSDAAAVAIGATAVAGAGALGVAAWRRFRRTDAGAAANEGDAGDAVNEGEAGDAVNEGDAGDVEPGSEEPEGT